jgi:hypothetical protein
MSALPRGQSTILNGGYSAWQAPLAAIFSGIGAAGQPGGWNNFSQGVQGGLNNFHQNQMQMGQAQRAEDLFKLQQEEFADRQRRANQEDAQRQATIDSLNGLLSPPQPATGAQGGQPVAAMFGGRPPQPASSQSALFGEYAGIPPHARQSAILSGYPEAVVKRGMEPDGTINLNKAGEGGIGAGAGPSTVAPNDGSQLDGGMNILGRDYTADQVAALRSMAATDPDGVMRLLQENAFAQPEEFNPDLTTFYDGNQQYQGYLDQNNEVVRVTPNSPRWEPNAPSQESATNLITLVAPDGKTTRSYDSRDPRVKQLAEGGWVERDRSLFPAPPIGYQPAAGGSGVEPIPGGPADPNRQTEAQRNEFKKQSLALDNLESALTVYEDALTKYGSTETYGEGKGVLENAYANVLIQAKEAAALGALTGPDMDIMNRTVIPPNGLDQLMVGGATGVKGQIGSFRGQLKQKRGNLNRLYAPGGEPASDEDYDSLYGLSPTN